jgi:hypothetical protein
MLRLNVEDDGVGFHVDEALAKRDSFGLSGIRERVALMGGKFSVKSVPASSAAGSGARNGAAKIVPVATAVGNGAGAAGEGTAVAATVAARGNGAGSGQGRLTKVEGHGGGTRDRDEDVFGASGEPGRGKSPKTGTRIQIELPVPIEEGHTGAPAAAGVARKSR